MPKTLLHLYLEELGILYHNHQFLSSIWLLYSPICSNISLLSAKLSQSTTLAAKQWGNSGDFPAKDSNKRPIEV